MQENANNIKIGHRNINSLGGFKLPEVEQMLTNGLYDILVLTETKLDD